ncbi:mannan endo-1,6-alpha-mannosidase [Aureobasidium subglaciale]|nr:mannan endo-1,6-alpha-mannosidase [Aureobasidium subglaciale]
MAFSTIYINLCFCAFWLASLTNAVTLDITDADSIRNASKTVAEGLMAWYAGNDTGGTPGILPGPYYWWEAGGMFGHMIDYWYYTGDDYYNSIVSTAIQFQVGTNDDFLPANQTKDEGNDDQVFWAFTAMDAAELNFPESTDADAPSWLSLAQAVFNEMAGRWDTSTCAGGLRWQIYSFNAGYNYKNSISNLGLFQLAARLGRYTGNTTYTDWAEKTWQWYSDVSLWDAGTYQVFDGTSTDDNCTSVDHFEWTYNYAAAIGGAAYMYNHTSEAKWLDIVEGLLNTTFTTFFPSTMGDKIMVEITCQPLGNCDTDQLSFRSYLARTLAVTTQLIPSLHETIYPYLRASAQGAAQQCDGGTTGSICGMEWNTTVWDGTYGVGQEMSALAVIQSLMLDTEDAAFTPPLTASTGGNSTSDPSAAPTQLCAGILNLLNTAIWKTLLGSETKFAERGDVALTSSKKEEKTPKPPRDAQDMRNQNHGTSKK